MSDRGAAIGLLVGFGGLLGGAIVESGRPDIILALVNLPSFMIVILGTFGATLIAFPLERVKNLPTLFKVAFRQPVAEERELVESFVSLADRARREGLLALESQVGNVPDPFMRKGLMLVVDGTDPELVREVLEADVSAMAERHEGNYAVLETMGGFGPTMGIIGTVMGLINVLSHLDKPEELGHSIAVAFIATLYGVMSANVLWLPFAQRLKQRHKEEASLRNLVIEGILSVQAGDHPRIVREKLESYLRPEMRGLAEEATAAASSTEAGAVAPARAAA